MYSCWTLSTYAGLREKEKHSMRIRGNARHFPWLISRAICQIICPFSPQRPAPVPSPQTERHTFIVNSTPNVRTWHFEYLELNCKHRSTTDGWSPATRMVSMILLFIGSLLTHAAACVCVYVCACACARMCRTSLLPRLAFVSRDLERYFVCLPLYLLNLLARPDFPNLSLSCLRWMTCHEVVSLRFTFRRTCIRN